MLDFLHMPSIPPDCRTARLLRSENGRHPSARTAFSPDALLGFHLHIPRRLGVTSAALALALDGGAELLSLPLVLARQTGGEEEYAALLDLACLAPHGAFFTYRIRLESAFGALYAARGVGARVCIVPNGTAEDCAHSLLLSQPAYPTDDAFLGGTVYAASPISQHTGALKSGFATEKDLLTHAERLGAHALWLTANGSEHPWRAEQILSPAFTQAADARGIALLVDFWLASGVRVAMPLVADRSKFLAQGRDFSPPSPEKCGTEPQIAAGGASTARTVCDHFCGREGVVSTWMGQGASGFVLRQADAVGDAFLSAARRKLAECGEASLLLGAVREGAHAAIAFGVRRRICFGEELDGLLFPAIGHALLAYLAEGEPTPLAHYLEDELMSYPETVLHRSLHILSESEESGFLHALARKDPQNAERLARLGYLIAATLPGSPLILAGEEYGAGEVCSDNDTLAYYTRLAQLRTREAVYRTGEMRLLHLDEGTLVFSREREGEALLTVVNTADTPFLLAGNFTVVFGGRGRKTRFRVPPKSGMVCRVSLWEGEEQILRILRGTEAECAEELPREEGNFVRFATHGVL